MKLEFSDDTVLLIVKALRVAIKHEAEVAAMSENNHPTIKAYEGALEKVATEVQESVKRELYARLDAMQVLPGNER